MALSVAVILFTWIRAARAPRTQPWFVAAHWRLSASRYRVLLAAYMISAAVVSLAFFGGDDHTDLERRIAELPPAMQEMERHKLDSQDMGSAIWARIGVVPLLLTVMALIMLESGALYQAGRGEVPDSLVARFPPPTDLAGSQQPLMATEDSERLASRYRRSRPASIGAITGDLGLWRFHPDCCLAVEPAHAEPRQLHLRQRKGRARAAGAGYNRAARSR